VKWQASGREGSYDAQGAGGHLYSIHKNPEGYHLKVSYPGPGSTVGQSAYYGTHSSADQAKEQAEKHNDYYAQAPDPNIWSGQAGIQRRIPKPSSYHER
jgi:hypothetical protein